MAASLFAVALLAPEMLEDFLIAKSLKRSFSERKLLYSTADFNISKIPREHFRHLFKFERNDILILADCLQIPSKFSTPERAVIDGITGLCMLLHRFTHPKRLKDAQNLFGRHFSTISRLLKCVYSFIFKKWGTHLLDFGENKWLTRAVQLDLCAASAKKGSPLKNVIGFVNATVREIHRPGKFQSQVNVERGKMPCLKFQNVTLPNGIILHMSSPCSSRRQNEQMLDDSKLLLQMQVYCPGFCLFGDQGYPLRPELMRPYTDTSSNVEKAVFNTIMGSLKECAEWSFEKIIQEFQFLDFSKNPKLFSLPIGQYYSIATLLTNAHTCLYGSKTSSFFDCPPIPIQHYFNKI